jgi:hypothetical protein
VGSKKTDKRSAERQRSAERTGRVRASESIRRREGRQSGTGDKPPYTKPTPLPGNKRGR